MTTFCTNCGNQAVDDNSVFCNNCGSKLIQNIPKINDTTYVGETIRSNEDSLPPASDIFNQSQKPKSLKPLKRRSMVLPAIVFFIAFALVLLVVSQTGVLNTISSLSSLTTSQEHMVVPANGTPIPTPSVSIVAPTTQTTLMNAVVTSSPMPPVTKVVSSTQTTQTPTPLPSVTTVAYTTQSTMKNIVETAEADGRFTTLVAAVKAADLNATLSDPDSHFTVFAPTDDAFRNLSGSIDPLLKDPQGDLLQILLYHIVSGNVTAVDLEKLTSVETLQGGTLQISVSNGVITVDGATVIVTDIECSNGVIHVVDTVMLPPA